MTSRPVPPVKCSDCGAETTGPVVECVRSIPRGPQGYVRVPAVLCLPCATQATGIWGRYARLRCAWCRRRVIYRQSGGKRRIYCTRSCKLAARRAKARRAEPGT